MAGNEEQGEEEEHAMRPRRLLAENVKRSDIAPWDRNDKKTSWQAWKMQSSILLRDSNVSEKRQISFILNALQGGSASAILTSWGTDGPPAEISIGDFWVTLDQLFAPEESNFHRDNRFKMFKLNDFSSISLYLERYQDEMAKCTSPPSEEYRLGVMETAIEDIPAISFHMEKWLRGRVGDNNAISFHFMQELRNCQVLMPKKVTATPAAAMASVDEDEDLLQKLAAKIAVIQGRSGRFKSNDAPSAEKFAGKCFHCGKIGHMKKECFMLKRKSPQKLAVAS